jgi:hypothetical protein
MLDKDKLRQRHRSPELWLLRAQSLTRLGPVAFGVSMGLLTLVLLMLPLYLYGYPTDILRDSLEGALFFGLSIGVLAGCSSPVFRGASADIAALQGVLPLSAVELSQLQASVTREPRREVLRTMLLGSACALLHSWLMALHEQPPLVGATTALGTLLLWIAMFSTVAPLIGNALIFSRLGAMANPDLLRPSRHAAFGRAALRPTLFIIAMLCVYPILALSGGLRGSVLFGFASTVLSLFALFFLPLGGIRRRIREVRETTLRALDARADRLYPEEIASARAEQLFELDAVLDIRERVARASAWPLDLQGVQRIMLYVILPPLTWAAAALVEIFIDGRL